MDKVTSELAEMLFRRDVHDMMESERLAAHIVDGLKHKWLVQGLKYQWLRDECTPEKNPQHTWILDAPADMWDEAIETAPEFVEWCVKVLGKK